MRKANIKGALVGVESVTPAGLKDIYKDFNFAGEELVERLQAFRKHGVHVLGSFIFGLPSDRPETFEATAELAQRADVTFAQFVMLTPFPAPSISNAGKSRWTKEGTRRRHPDYAALADPQAHVRRCIAASGDDAGRIRDRTQGVWDEFYSLGNIWKRSTLHADDARRLAFVLISKLYRQMYANTGIATDSARVSRAEKWARAVAPPTRKLFAAPPMPELQVPN